MQFNKVFDSQKLSFLFKNLQVWFIL